MCHKITSYIFQINICTQNLSLPFVLYVSPSSLSTLTSSAGYVAPFLGAFAKLRKATISLIMSLSLSLSPPLSLRLSTHIEQFGSHCTGFGNILCLNISLYYREN